MHPLREDTYLIWNDHYASQLTIGCTVHAWGFPPHKLPAPVGHLSTPAVYVAPVLSLRNQGPLDAVTLLEASNSSASESVLKTQNCETSMDNHVPRALCIVSNEANKLSLQMASSRSGVRNWLCGVVVLDINVAVRPERRGG